MGEGSFRTEMKGWEESFFGQKGRDEGSFL
jgi:hypothetical protein